MYRGCLCRLKSAVSDCVRSSSRRVDDRLGWTEQAHERCGIHDNGRVNNLVEKQYLCVSSFVFIACTVGWCLCYTAGMSTTWSMTSACGNMVLRYHGHELRLRYPNSLLGLVYGRHPSLCQQKNAHCSVTELGWWAQPAPVEPNRAAQQKHRTPFHCVASVQSLKVF